MTIDELRRKEKKNLDWYFKKHNLVCKLTEFVDECECIMLRKEYEKNYLPFFNKAKRMEGQND